MYSETQRIGLYLDHEPPEMIGEEEINRLLLLSKDGDTSARDELVMGFSRMAIMLAAKYSKNTIEFDDALSVAFLSLVNAVEKFDIHFEKCKFSTYAYRAICMNLVNSKRKEYVKSKRFRFFDLDEEIPGSLDHDTYKDLLPSPVNETQTRFDTLCLMDDVRDLLKCLKDRDRKLVILRYGLDGNGMRTLEEVGDLMGLCKQRVSTIMDRCLRQMKAEAIKKGCSFEM